jgi:hypothetical protein
MYRTSTLDTVNYKTAAGRVRHGTVPYGSSDFEVKVTKYRYTGRALEHGTVQHRTVQYNDVPYRTVL